MIVPRTRLLLWFAIIVVPFATLGGVVESTAGLAFATVGLFALTVILDAVLTLGRLREVSLALTPLIRTAQDRPFKINVRLHNPSQKARALRLTLAFPPELKPDEEELSVTLPADTDWSAFDWPCATARRGKFQITSARLEGISPLGFWAQWKTLSVATEVRAYPSLARERNNLAALFLNRGAFGIHAQRQVGRGREFEKLREYVPGDGIEDIHWKATAKRGRPVTKVFQIERTQEVYVVIDASRLSARAASVEGSDNPQPISTLERFITATLTLGLAAEQQGDLFGLLTFSDKIETFLRARNGAAHYHACRDAIYTLQPREVAPDFDELGTFIRLRLRRRALLIFLTSLDDPVAAESFVRNMDLVAGQHLVLVNMLQPPGAHPFFTNASVNSEDELYGELAGHMRWHGLRELEKVLQRRGVRLSLLASERMAVGLVSQYLNVKQRQVL